VWYSDPDGCEAGSVFPSDGARAAFILEMAVIATFAPEASLAIAVFVALVLLFDTAAVMGLPQGGEGRGAGRAGESGSSGCAPAELSRVAAPGWIFPPLLLLQLVLGLLVLRGRERGGGADE